MTTQALFIRIIKNFKKLALYYKAQTEILITNALQVRYGLHNIEQEFAFLETKPWRCLNCLQLSI